MSEKTASAPMDAPADVRAPAPAPAPPPDYEAILAEQLAELERTVRAYGPDADVDLILRAYTYSKHVHGDQRRKSGEPYVIHPLAVAQLLADLHLDPETISAGLLHDTIEDTLATREDIAREFGENVADMVEGLSKLSKMKFQSKEVQAAENFRKMIFAMTRDIRVILVKLCDRTHNMRTLEHMPEHKQRRISQETMDIYAPIANRLGISSLKVELENLSFKYLHPDLYRDLRAQLEQTEKERQSYIKVVTDQLKKLMDQHHVNVKEVSGRLKHDWSIYKKMVKKNVSLEDISDIIAFRIIVDGVGDCYQALGVVHGLWKPISERFKDFIAVPKLNGYRSLHTTVLGPGGERIEIQIRTAEMHEVSEHGIAAHWGYKEGRRALKKEEMERLGHLRRLFDVARDMRDPSEFMENIKDELFGDEVYVFTPKGSVVELPEGATPLDFAYAIHTDVGNTCVGARVDGRQVPLRFQLTSGQTVEIQTKPDQRPNKDWLEFVTTARAKSKIRTFIRQQERDRGVQLGRDSLEKDLRGRGQNLIKLTKAGNFDKLVGEKSRFKSLDDLYYAVSLGKINAEQILEEILPPSEREKDKKGPTALDTVLKSVRDRFTTKKASSSPVRIRGEGDILVSFAKCCNPLPGDDIVGLITRGHDISVHQSRCPNVLAVDLERRVEVEWEEGARSSRPATIRVQCKDEDGLLATMTKTISQQEVSIRSVDARGGEDGRAVCHFEIMVPNRDILTKVMLSLERIRGVTSVERVRHYAASEG